MRRGVVAFRAGVFAGLSSLVAAGLTAPLLTQPAEASIAAAHAAPRVLADDTVLGTFTSVGGGVNGTVYALALQGDDTLYAGGSFTSAGGRSDDSYIAALSMSSGQWHPLGGGANDTVYALAMEGDDTLYAGGSFTSAGGRSDDSYIAAWSSANGTWHALAGGVSGGIVSVRSLAVQKDDTLYVGGNFQSASGIAGTNKIAAWSNADDTWHSVGRGMVDANNYHGTFALAVQRGTLFAGGLFDSAGGVAGTDRIAKWPNSDDTWRALGGGLNSTVRALVVQGDDTVFAGGAFGSAGGKPGATGIARWSNLDDTWHAVGGGVSGGFLSVASLALDDTRGLLYVGGFFGTAGTVEANNVAVWDAGIGAWIPMQAAGGNGTQSPHVYAIALDDSVVYLGGDFTTAGGVAVNRVARWTWDAPTAVAVPASGAAGAPIALEGSGLIGVSGVRVDGTPVAYTRDDSTMISLTLPGGLSPGSHSITVDAVGGRATTAYVVSGSPTPPPVYPPGAPTSALAVAGDASASVSWVAPTSAGSFPVSNYQVTAAPGGKSCLVSAPTLTCEVTGLANGTSYTFTVRALNGAGWGASSGPSNAVTPMAPPSPSMVITGSRGASDSRVVRVTGTTTELIGEQVTPWIRFPGEASYSAGSGTRTVDAEGRFEWNRRSGKRISVYFAHGSMKSNTVIIPAR